MVPLPDEAIAIVKRRLAVNDGPWLFRCPPKCRRKGPRLNAGQVYYQVTQAMKRAGIDKGTTHTFRHAYCSFMANNNVPPLMVMKIMGHSSLDIILTYYHVDEQDLAKVFGTLSFTSMLGRPAISASAEAAAA